MLNGHGNILNTWWYNISFFSGVNGNWLSAFCVVTETAQSIY